MPQLEPDLIAKLKYYCRGIILPDHPGPCSVDDFTYADNGIMVIRVPSTFGNLHERAKQCSEFMAKHFDCSGSPTTLTVDDVFPFLCVCTECAEDPASLTKRIKCPECRGTGEVELETDYNTYEVECKTCDGEGTIAEGSTKCRRAECTNCHGTGLAPKKTKYRSNDKNAVRIGPAFINPAIALRLAIDFGPITFYAPKLSYSAVPFRFDGGEGIVMPLVV